MIERDMNKWFEFIVSYWKYIMDFDSYFFVLMEWMIMDVEGFLDGFWKE